MTCSCLRIRRAYEPTANRKDCDSLAADSKEASQPRAETEAHLLFARYVTLQCSIAENRLVNDTTQNWDPKQSTSEMRDRAFEHLESARELCKKYPGSTRGLLEETNAAERMLRGSWFEPVSSDERRQVLLATQGEFSGIGHWYVHSDPLRIVFFAFMFPLGCATFLFR